MANITRKTLARKEIIDLAYIFVIEFIAIFVVVLIIISTCTRLDFVRWTLPCASFIAMLIVVLC